MTPKQSHVVLDGSTMDHRRMNTAQLSLQKARDFAASLRTSRHHGRGWQSRINAVLRKAAKLPVLKRKA